MHNGEEGEQKIKREGGKGEENEEKKKKDRIGRWRSGDEDNPSLHNLPATFPILGFHIPL